MHLLPPTLGTQPFYQPQQPYPMAMGYPSMTAAYQQPMMAGMMPMAGMMQPSMMQPGMMQPGMMQPGMMPPPAAPFASMQMPYMSTNPEDNPRFGPVAKRGFEIDPKPFKIQRKVEKRKLK